MVTGLSQTARGWPLDTIIAPVNNVVLERWDSSLTPRRFISTDCSVLVGQGAKSIIQWFWLLFIRVWLLESCTKHICSSHIKTHLICRITHTIRWWGGLPDKSSKFSWLPPTVVIRVGLLWARKQGRFSEGFFLFLVQKPDFSICKMGKIESKSCLGPPWW